MKYKSNLLKLPIAFLQLVLIMGCSITNDKSSLSNDGHNKPFDEKLTLVSQEDKRFVLDSLTSTDRLRLQYFYDKTSKKEFLYLLDIVGQSIQTFDWQTGSLLKKVKLAKEGPNGVGNAEQFFVASPDSIFVLSYFSLKLSLLDSEAKIKNYYRLLNGGDGQMKLGTGVHPLTKEHTPITVMGNYVLLGGYPHADRWKRSFYSDGEIGIKVNMTTKEVTSLMKLPSYFLERYDQNGTILCGQQVTGIGQTYNHSSKKIIVNIPTEPLLYFVDVEPNKEADRFYAGSKQFDQIVLAKKNLKDMKKEFDYYTHTPTYEAVYYDNVNQLYWRFVSVPNPQKRNEFDGKSWVILSVILLDKDLKKVGETVLDDTVFRTPSVLFTANETYLKQYTAKESEVVFTRFKPIKL